MNRKQNVQVVQAPSSRVTPAWWPDALVAWPEAGSWFAVPVELREAYLEAAGDAIPLAAQRAFDPAHPWGWFRRSAVSFPLPDGVSVLAETNDRRPPVSGLVYDPAGPMVDWVRLGFTDSDAGLACWHHVRLIGQVRGQASRAAEAARIARGYVFTCALCDQDTDRQARHVVEGTSPALAVCPPCARAMEFTIAMRALERVLADGRTAAEGASDLVDAAGVPLFAKVVAAPTGPMFAPNPAAEQQQRRFELELEVERGRAERADRGNRAAG